MSREIAHILNEGQSIGTITLINPKKGQKTKINGKNYRIEKHNEFGWAVSVEKIYEEFKTPWWAYLLYAIGSVLALYILWFLFQYIANTGGLQIT